VDAGSARLHIASWMLWWIAALAGWVVLAVGCRRRPAFAITTLLVAAIVLLALHASVLPMPGGLRERIALAIWFGWIAAVSWRRAFSRSAVSAAGSTAPARR
jgi:FtsH-binding integral membrane protein